MRMIFDTINVDELAKVATRYEVPPVLRLSDSWGAGCFLDAPGFPTYFLRSVYTAQGNTPRNGPDHVLGVGKDLWRFESDDYEKLGPIYRRIYRPLPLDHPRVKLWILAVARHLRSCYRDEERQEYGRPGTLIYPVPGYKLKTPHIDHRWTDEYKQAAIDEAEAFNKMERDRADRIATIDNHMGVRNIREIYPDFQPPAWFLNPPADMGQPADWWEMHDSPPEPGKCVGDYTNGKGVPWRHSDSNCQFCGAGRNSADPNLITL